MPDASVIINEAGVYFCDYGGGGREVLGKLIAMLGASFGPVVIAELE